MSTERVYFVYLIKCKDGSIYTGITTDVKRRLQEHKDGLGGRYTRSHGIKKLLYSEKHLDKSSALKRELEIKSWNKKKKVSLAKKPRV